MLPLRFQKQLRLFQNPLPDGGRSVPPGGIQLPGLAAGEVVGTQRFRQALAVFRAGTRHRHQILHRHVSGEGAVTNLLLDAGGKQFDQRQPSRYPAHAVIEAARQLLQTIPKALLQFCQQPALFQRRLVLAPAQRAVEHQRLRLAQRPDHRLHRVPAQLLQRRQPLVAVDHQVTIRRVGHRHHHNRRLLAGGGQRSQQPPLSLRTANPQMFSVPIELVKLQSHRQLPATAKV